MTQKLFEITTKDTRTRARAGILRTAHGQIRTPVFMPVGTQATVKGISSAELTEAGAQIILSNAYHLYLRPGEEVIREAGGLHRFMSWPRPILTDSGGFQIFSLSKFTKIKKDGVEFKSHLDGSKHFLTPERVVEIQHALGSDILMPLDECVEHPAEKEYIRKSVELTAEWAKRSKAAWENAGRVNGYDRASILFGIVQGGAFKDLRKKAARQIVELDFPGHAIGGLSVGEPQEVMGEMLEAALPELPEEKPRYLMGLGLPSDLFAAVERGVDMFDCVVPTRNGRNATVFTGSGRLLLRGAAFTRDPRPIEENCPCYACRTYSRSYLRHLFNAEEHLAGRLASLHNLTFFIQLLESMRKAIEENRFSEFRLKFLSDYEADTSSGSEP
ncbi:MAG: tRNA guanosine(34) transglycosylase Tgt [Elusimicrobiota bacterium]